MPMYPTFKLKVTDHGWKSFLQRAGTMVAWGKSSVEVGVFVDGLGAHSRNGVTLAEVAAINEFGSDDGHVPERSFLRATFDRNKEDYFLDLKSGVELALDGHASFPEVLAQLGERVTGDVRNYILTGAGVPPPNAPSTIRKKLAKGSLTPGHRREGDRFRNEATGRFASAASAIRTLVDEGLMVAAIEWRVIKKRRD